MDQPVEYCPQCGDAFHPSEPRAEVVDPGTSAWMIVHADTCVPVGWEVA